MEGHGFGWIDDAKDALVPCCTPSPLSLSHSHAIHNTCTALWHGKHNKWAFSANLQAHHGRLWLILHFILWLTSISGSCLRPYRKLHMALQTTFTNMMSSSQPKGKHICTHQTFQMDPSSISVVRHRYCCIIWGKGTMHQRGHTSSTLHEAMSIARSTALKLAELPCPSHPAFIASVVMLFVPGLALQIIHLIPANNHPMGHWSSKKKKWGKGKKNAQMLHLHLQCVSVTSVGSAPMKFSHHAMQSKG